MRYAQIRSMDISNGENIGVSLFVQGCPFHCYNCFNSSTWDFNGGNQWTEDTKKKFLQLANKSYIKRISILGGEPLYSKNLDDVLSLIKEIRKNFPEKTIWLYTGYEWNQIMNIKVTQPFFSCQDLESKIRNVLKRQEIIKMCNVVVDGEYIDRLRDVTLKWRGSSNQRVIDVQKSLEQNKVVLYCD